MIKDRVIKDLSLYLLLYLLSYTFASILFLQRFFGLGNRRDARAPLSAGFENQSPTVDCWSDGNIHPLLDEAVSHGIKLFGESPPQPFPPIQFTADGGTRH